MRISVFGLGKLGAPLAVALASKGHDVVGYDVDPEPGRLLQSGAAPVAEPGLAERLAGVAGRLTTTADPREAVHRADVSFIVVPTPSDESGGFSPRFAVDAAATIGRALRDKAEYHLVVLTSTVMPGTTREVVVPALEAAAGARCGDRFGVCYNPEFIALGSVIRDMLRPDFVLIGESDARAGGVLEALYRQFCENDPPVARMGFDNAELAKLALNTFVTMKIAFANALADLCERLPGGDVDAVTAAVGLDARVGRKYLTGAVGYGGPCFPRDVTAFAALARRCGTEPFLAEATRRANDERLTTILGRVLELAAPGTVVGVLGLAYKPGTPVIECSPAIDLVTALLAAGRPVIVFDPAAMASARSVLGETVVYASSADDLVGAADVSVVMTPWPEFRQLRPRATGSAARQKTVIDCWRTVDPTVAADGRLELVYLGRSATPRAQPVTT